jgi:hypothetical protein
MLPSSNMCFFPVQILTTVMNCFVQYGSLATPKLYINNCLLLSVPLKAMLDKRQMETGASVHEEKNPGNSDQLMQDFERQLLHWPGLWNL